jgi:membrane protein YdbS with pleckstrin-like domain
MLAEYRPIFVLWTSFLAQLPLQLFFTLWAGAFFGGLLSMIFPTGTVSATVHVGSPFLIVGIAVLVLFPIVTLAARWLNYSNTVYRVYSDRIEIEEGFLTLHRKEIPLASVREINLRRGILQRLVGLGSIYLATPATGQGPWWSTSAIVGGTSTFGSGAMLMDLANANIVYGRLRELVERARPTGPNLAT